MNSFNAGDTWIVKIGSSLVTDGGRGLATGRVEGWAQQIAALKEAGKRIVLVSSGAIIEGMARLGMAARPSSLADLQAAAAVGQAGLVQAYEASFARYGIRTALVLLTHADLRNRQRYLNARSALRRLLALGVVPVVNENDSVVTDEIRFGDNDTLAALVANLLEAETLVILTDQAGLYSAPPGNADARLIDQAEATDASLYAMAGTGSATGRGGMVTKIDAARIAARSGANTVIASGERPEVLLELMRGEVNGSLLSAGQGTMVARKRWLATLAVKGRLHLDAGACKVVAGQGRSLLAVGVQGADGRFERGDMVACLDQNGQEVARGLINYGVEEVAKIQGKPSKEIEAALGYMAEEELIHRDNLVLPR